jgi:hypothetical protein
LGKSPIERKGGDPCRKYDDRLTEILWANNFQTRANRLLELSFALGTGAFVEYKNADGDVVIDYIRADMIYR